jgi:hypothetical protein
MRAGEADRPTTGPGGADNWFDELKKVDEKSAKPIGFRDIAGKRARGFKVTDPAGDYVVWADAKTAVPLRVEMSTRAAGSEMSVVMDRIAFDVDLPESLFSVEPPPGYALQNAAASAGAPGEQDMVSFLRDFAKATGAYPSSLDDWNKTFQAVLPKGGDSRKKPDPAVLNVILEGGRAASFLGSLPKDANWHYAGNTVRPGEAKPLFWYRLGESQTYRALYSDLHISELKEGDLPK